MLFAVSLSLAPKIPSWPPGLQLETIRYGIQRVICNINSSSIYVLRLCSILSGIFISAINIIFGLHAFNSYCVQPACAFYNSVPFCSPFHSTRSSSSGPREPSGGPCTDYSQWTLSCTENTSMNTDLLGLILITLRHLHQRNSMKNKRPLQSKITCFLPISLLKFSEIYPTPPITFIIYNPTES